MRSPEHLQVAPPRAGRRFEDELQLHYLAPGAFTILPPERRRPADPPPVAPEPYRLTPGTKRHKKPSFAIIGDVNTSGGSSPSGRVSPFKGRGFNPIGSRHGSPSRSPPPPEDARLTPTNLSPSKIPLPQKKFGNNAKRRISNKLSQSLSDLDAKVAQEAKQGTRRQMHTKTTGFQKLSPIIGSSPEPSQSMSSPSRIPRSQSTPPSRKPSPSRYNSSILSKPPMSNSSVVRSRSQSRSQSRNASRNASRTASREPSPTKAPTSPSRIPLSRYKNVQAKVNSNNKPKPKVLPKPEVSSEQSDSEPAKTKFKTPLSRKESVNRIRTDSRPNLLPKTGNYSKNIYPSTSDSSVGNVNTKNSGKGNGKYSSGTAPSNEKKTLNKTNVIEKDHGEKRNDTEATTANSDNSSEPNSKNEKSDKIEDLDTTETESENNNAVLTTKTTPTSGNEIIIQPDVSKKPDNFPSTATAVSSTTSTVVKPLKIETNLNYPDHVEKPQPRSPMIDGRVLSATSVSNAINKMNDTVMDSQTLMRERGFSKLSPAANAVISVANEANKMNNSTAIDTKNATTALPTVPEPLKKNGERLAPKDNHVSSNNHNHNDVHAKQIEHVLSSKALELEVQKHIQKMISPVPKGNKSRSVVTSDVQPIQIMVREKPSDIEVQSGNIRPVINVSNGINERPGLPPSQVTPPNEPEKQPPPKNACTKLFANCKSRMCSCCMRNGQSEPANNTEDGVGCFGCVKKKHGPANIIIENEKDKKPVGCFSCSKKKQEPARIVIENETDKKPKLLDRFNCCKSQKVGDMNCFPKGKRKESWAERRDSIMSTSTAYRPKNDCKSILRKMFCLNRCCKRKGIEDLVRQPSIVSKKKSLTPTTALPPDDTSPKIDLSLVEHSSHMRAAIPILPICLAWFCLVMNCIAPGTGTVFSGMFCLCIGIPRFSQKDGPRPRVGSFIINIIIGIGQFFTVLFCLVGWGWSIWWGVIMLKIAKKHKKFKHFEAIEQASSMPPVHPNSRQPVQQKRT